MVRRLEPAKHWLPQSVLPKSKTSQVRRSFSACELWRRELCSPCTARGQPLHCHFACCAAKIALVLSSWHGMNYDPNNPLIVQGDRSVLVEVDNPRYAAARDALAPFAELEKSPEHIHTYRLTPLSLWNAAAAGMTAAAMIDVLGRFSKFPLPANLAPS